MVKNHLVIKLNALQLMHMNETVTILKSPTYEVNYICYVFTIGPIK